MKSNSCSSRLELTGTLPRDQKNKLAISPEPLSELTAEESVRELVNRLEVVTTNQTNIPRIIESKCIEKVNLPIPDELTINNQYFDTKSNVSDPADSITHVTVNNHITLKTPNKNKLQRNKNVDLAYQNGKVMSSKPVKEMENIVKQNLDKSNQSPSANHQTFEEAKEMFSTAFDNISKVEDRLKDELVGHPTNNRLVKWESINTKFDEKFFIANDLKLKEQKKYDEMEFEEFEVYDPRHECYDSLNSVTAVESK